MADFILSGTIGKDHRLVVDVPKNIPPGPVEVVIRSMTSAVDQPHNLTREEARARLRAAGIRLAQYPLDSDFVPMDEEEFQAYVNSLPSGGRPSEELVDEDRGEY